MAEDVRIRAVGPDYPGWSWQEGQHRHTDTFVRDMAFMDADNRTLYGLGLFRDNKRLTDNKAAKKHSLISVDAF
jgi:hypothetical protein